MSKGRIKNFYTQEPKSGNTKNMVILMHGVGSNGRDLVSLAPMWQEYLPDTLFVSPDAPFHCDMAPAGYPDCYQWFSLQNRDPEVMLQGVRQVRPLIDEFIDERLESSGLAAEKLALVGFSQGTMCALYAGPRYKSPLAGILGYSGALLWDDKEDITNLHKIPINLIHGEMDDVVPVSAWRQAMDILARNGFSVSGYTQPGLHHSIDQTGIEKGGEFLREILVA